jgi:hypothetical protein
VKVALLKPTFGSHRSGGPGLLAVCRTIPIGALAVRRYATLRDSTPPMDTALCGDRRSGPHNECWDVTNSRSYTAAAIRVMLTKFSMATED